MKILQVEDRSGSSDLQSHLFAAQSERKGLLHGYEWRLRFGALELRFG